MGDATAAEDQQDKNALSKDETEDEISDKDDESKMNLYENIRKQMEFYFSEADNNFLGKLMEEKSCKI